MLGFDGSVLHTDGSVTKRYRKEKKPKPILADGNKGPPYHDWYNPYGADPEELAEQAHHLPVVHLKRKSAGGKGPGSQHDWYNPYGADPEELAEKAHHLPVIRLVDPRTGAIHDLLDLGELGDGEDDGLSTFTRPPRDWAHRGPEKGPSSRWKREGLPV
jgi:hypothetical protein